MFSKNQSLPSLNNGLKCRKPVFMWVSGICFIKWLWFGSICGESNELEYTEGEQRYVNLVNKRMGNINMGMYQVIMFERVN